MLETLQLKWIVENEWYEIIFNKKIKINIWNNLE